MWVTVLIMLLICLDRWGAERLSYTPEELERIRREVEERDSLRAPAHEVAELDHPLLGGPER